MADWRVCATDDGVGRGFLAGGPFTRCIQSHSPEVLISLNINMLAPSFQGLWLLRIRSNQLIQEWRQASGRQEQTEPPSRGRVRTPFKGRSSRYQITGVNQGHDFAFGLSNGSPNRSTRASAGSSRSPRRPSAKRRSGIFRDMLRICRRRARWCSSIAVGITAPG